MNILLLLIAVVSLFAVSSLAFNELKSTMDFENSRKIWGECGACKMAASSVLSAGCGAGSGACGPFASACELLCTVISVIKLSSHSMFSDFNDL